MTNCDLDKVKIAKKWAYFIKKKAISIEELKVEIYPLERYEINKRPSPGVGINKKCKITYKSTPLLQDYNEE